MAPRFTPLTKARAALICMLLVLVPQSIVGFAGCDKQASFSSPSSSKLSQSSRVLLSDEAASPSISLPPLARVVQNLQERFAKYRHLRQQQKLLKSASSEPSSSLALQGLVPVVKQFLYTPNKVLLQGYIMAHQQAQYDHLHAYHEQALESSSCLSLFADEPTSLVRRFAQRRRETKNARLSAKYAAIESLEDRAFQICKDLGMI